MLTGRVFDSRILEKTEMVELVEYVWHQGWLHLLEGPVPSVYKREGRAFYSTIEFSNYGLSLTALVQGKKLSLDEEILGKILYVLIVGVRTISK